MSSIETGSKPKNSSFYPYLAHSRRMLPSIDVYRTKKSQSFNSNVFLRQDRKKTKTKIKIKHLNDTNKNKTRIGSPQIFFQRFKFRFENFEEAASSISSATKNYLFHHLQQLLKIFLFKIFL